MSKAEDSHSLVYIMFMLRSLLLRVGEVGVRTAIDVRPWHCNFTMAQMSWGEAVAGTNNRLDGSVDDGLVRRFVKAVAGDLR